MTPLPYTLYQGDCRTALNEVPDKSVDLVLCDPPFGTTNCKGDKVIPPADLWALYRRVLKPTGCVILFGSQPFTSELVQSNRPWFRHELIGDKNKCGSPGLAKVRPMKTHENILVFSPGAHTYNPQMEQGEPYARRCKDSAGYVGKENRHGYGLKPRTEFVNHGTRYPKSIINMRRDFSAQQQVHPHQKPVHTMAWLILTYSNKGGTVLDNTMGAGSTGVACMQLGSYFIGCEEDPEHYEVARQRIHEAATAFGRLSA